MDGNMANQQEQDTLILQGVLLDDQSKEEDKSWKSVLDKTIEFTRTRVTWGQLRNPMVFFGLGGQGANSTSPRPFNFEGSPSDLLKRFRSNLSYFLANYALIIVSFLAISMLTNPMSLIYLAILAGGWFFILRKAGQAAQAADVGAAAKSDGFAADPSTHQGNPGEPFLVLMGGKIKVTRYQAFIGMSILSLVLIVLLLQAAMSWLFWISVVLVIAHGIMRDFSPPDENAYPDAVPQQNWT
uniref:PRA1 family protein n=1 Tax=Fibrocapsa japonica TaxID=94617 RepID=A0A7S2V1H3_9STRA|mmetsp:Transcript_24122/g.35075  ORF Transcript_24122/g.35075 Transcript_24122/m.35075 type:complete len:241 (+) Transcript_24122:19-741(+)